MARANSKAESMLNQVLAEAVTPCLRSARFRKKGMNYHRRLGRTVQVVNIQVSTGSSSVEKEFFLNAGIAFDKVCELVGVPVLEHPKEYECDRRGTRDRLGDLILGAPASYVLRVGEEWRCVSTALRRFVEQLVAELDKIDSPVAYRSHQWFNRFRPAEVNAQILYLLGDKCGARREVEDLATLFADRMNANRVDWWVGHLGLTDLTAR